MATNHPLEPRVVSNEVDAASYFHVPTILPYRNRSLAASSQTDKEIANKQLTNT